MCNICEGTSPESQLRSLRSMFEQFGWTSIHVEADERSLSWAYTIGMAGAGHPELVLADQPPELTARMFEALAPEVLDGRTLAPGSTIEMEGRTWVVVPIDPSVIRAGILGWWPDVFPHCDCHSEPDAVELIDAEVLRRHEGDQRARLDRRYGASEGRLTTRAARRRRARSEAKPRRRG